MSNFTIKESKNNSLDKIGFQKLIKKKEEANEGKKEKTFRELSSSCFLNTSYGIKKKCGFNESYNMRNILSPVKNLEVDLLCFEINVKLKNANKKKKHGDHDFNIISNVENKKENIKENSKIKSNYKPINIVEIGKNEENKNKIKVKRFDMQKKEPSLKKRILYKQEEDHIDNLYDNKISEKEIFVDKISNKMDTRVLNNVQKQNVVKIVSEFSQGKFSSDVLLKKLKDNNVVSNSIEVSIFEFLRLVKWQRMLKLLIKTTTNF